MAKLPLPERGQPLDLSYIYQMASVINELSSQISPSNSKYVTLDTPSSGKQSVKASEARIIGGFESVVSNTSVTVGTEKDFSYGFPADFKYIPIVTATPVDVLGTDAGKDVSLVITSITTSDIRGKITFNKAGEVGIGVNFLAIGIPN